MTPPSLLALLLLIVLYALAWHDKPAHQQADNRLSREEAPDSGRVARH